MIRQARPALLDPQGDGRYVLVWFTNLGEPGCNALPHQLRVGEVTIVRA